MAIATSEIPKILIDRIAYCHPAPALFASAEFQEWPEGAITSLIEADVLRLAGRAETVVCPGCEWQCHKPVVVRTPVGQHTPRAFIMCDEEPGHGRVPLPLSMLDQYATGLLALGSLVASALQLQAPRSSTSGNSCPLGQIKGRRELRSVALSLEADDLFLVVGSHREPMSRLLRWSAAGLIVDTEHVKRLANRKERLRSSKHSYQSDRSRQRARSRKMVRRDKKIFEEAKKRHEASGETWTAIAKAIAGAKLAGGITPSRVRRIISQFRKN